MDRLLNLREAAELLGVHPRTLRRWIAAGRIRAAHLSPRALRIHPIDLEAAYLEAALKEADADRAARDARHAR